DFLIGEPYYSTIFPKRVDCGRVHVCSGATGAELFAIVGASQGDALGWSVGAIGDVDGDRIPDLLAGAVDSQSGAGSVVVASGKDGSTLRTQVGANPGDQLGAAVAGMGDMNHDGVDDYVVGASHALGPSGALGAALVYSGATGVLLWEVDGDSNFSHQNAALGYAVASGDFNGDGIADFVAGDPEYSYYYSRGGWSMIGRSTTWFGCP